MLKDKEYTIYDHYRAKWTHQKKWQQIYSKYSPLCFLELFRNIQATAITMTTITRAAIITPATMPIIFPPEMVTITMVTIAYCRLFRKIIFPSVPGPIQISFLSVLQIICLSYLLKVNKNQNIQPVWGQTVNYFMTVLHKISVEDWGPTISEKSESFLSCTASLS